jgi:hypothetical protein
MTDASRHRAANGARISDRSKPSASTTVTHRMAAGILTFAATQLIYPSQGICRLNATRRR